MHVMLHGAKDFPLYLPHQFWFVAIKAGALPVSLVVVLRLFTGKYCGFPFSTCPQVSPGWHHP